jgi:hypothetical protein
MAAPSPLPPGTNVVTSGPPHRAILRLALPTTVAMLSQSIVNEIDIVFFARLPCPESSNAQAALLPSLILLWLFGGSLSAISVGTQAYTGRRFAEGRYEEAGAVLANAAFFSLVAGIVFTAIGYLVMSSLLPLILRVEGARDAARRTWTGGSSASSRWSRPSRSSRSSTASANPHPPHLRGGHEHPEHRHVRAVHLGNHHRCAAHGIAAPARRVSPRTSGSPS